MHDGAPCIAYDPSISPSYHFVRDLTRTAGKIPLDTIERVCSIYFGDIYLMFLYSSRLRHLRAAFVSRASTISSER